MTVTITYEVEVPTEWDARTDANATTTTVANIRDRPWAAGYWNAQIISTASTTSIAYGAIAVSSVGSHLFVPQFSSQNGEKSGIDQSNITVEGIVRLNTNSGTS
jgi:hypothetical protein